MANTLLTRLQEPEENANDNAIEAWEREKQLQALLSVRFESQLRQDQASDTPSEPPHTGGIYIELQSRSDFLRSRPGFDTASIIPISASQLSDYPHPDSERDLPPSQFWVTSSQPSQDLIVADSQPLATGSPAPQQVGGIRAHAGISQTTIPDSQDFSNGLNQDLVEVPGTAEDLHQGAATSPKPSNKKSSGSTIPSHQPNINQVSFAHDLLVVETERQLVPLQDFQPNLSPPLPTEFPGTQASLRPVSSRTPLDGFLTQPAFEIGEFSLSVESKTQSPSHVATTATYTSRPAENLSLNESHQPAQKVSPLSDKTSQFLTQTQIGYFSVSEDYEVVPDSSLRNLGQSGHSQQALFHRPVADTVADSVCRTTATHSQHVGQMSQLVFQMLI